VIADLIGKAAHIRTVPVPDWVKSAVDEWTTAAPVKEGRLFRCVSRKGSVWGDGITEKVIWHVVKAAAATAGIAKLSPHDCRRTCARLCHAAGGELEQIQFLLGHVSVETRSGTWAASSGYAARSTTGSGWSRSAHVAPGVNLR